MSAEKRPVAYLSYRWQGGQEHAELLGSFLRQAVPDFEIFWDASIQPGEHWPMRLRQGLEQASALLVLIDPDWLRYQDEYGRRKIDDPKDWVRQEIEQALRRGILLLPIVLEDAKIPPTEALPEPLQPITQRQFARLRLGHFEKDAEGIAEALRPLKDSETRTRSVVARESFQVLDLEISDFRGLKHFELVMARQSTLSGLWTCAAGINGAGKSTLLQALALLMMGPERARELGGERLRRMRRRGLTGREFDALLRARVRFHGEEHQLELLLTDDGPKGPDTRFWKEVDGLLAVGYGASRNLSDSPDRYQQLSPMVRTNISLFDPMARLEKAEVLLRSSPKRDVAARCFRTLVSAVFAEEVEVEIHDERLEFFSGGSTVGPQELPDGFRSSVAWMADLCARWVGVGSLSESPSDITGLALVDEIDLHLHASLQRAIVPRLRQALPRLQFVVSSHSPLILSSFDRNELVLLDRDAEGGVRPTLDRQILGFTADQVYEWLLGTPPSSEAFERELKRSKSLGVSRREELAELLETSREVDPAKAKARVARIRDRVRKLHQ